jgi:hypothetical protein
MFAAPPDCAPKEGPWMRTAYATVLVTLAISCAAHAVPAASKESTSQSPQSLVASAMAYATVPVTSTRCSRWV